MTDNVGSYAHSPTERVRAANGVDYAYRRLGAGRRPLVLLQHFRGNLDNWDSALVDRLTGAHDVVAFDNTGVGGSSGLTPRTVAQMAADALDFMDALSLEEVDLLGFSLGSFVAQEIALARPGTVRRLVLASSAPQGAPGMHGWDKAVIDGVGGREPNPSGYLDVFYTSSAASRTAGQASLQRIVTERTAERDEPTSWQTRQAQYDAVCTWGISDISVLARVTSIERCCCVVAGAACQLLACGHSAPVRGITQARRRRRAAGHGPVGRR
jgi:pimeloyl-ACP methyl ester carboxylesterase